MKVTNMNTFQNKYEIVDSKDGEESGIRLTNPDFGGLVIRFGKIGIHEEKEEAVLAFDYDILSGEVPTDPFKLQKLENELGDILVDLLENHFDEGEVVGGDD